MKDVQIDKHGATASVIGHTDDGIAFADAWLLGVLSVEDAGEVTITREVLEEVREAAELRGLSVVVTP
jgi:hypothetical protein